MTDQQLPAGLLTAEEVIAAIRIPDDVGLDYGAVRVQVFDRATRRAIGMAMYDKKLGKATNFVRSLERFTDEFAIQSDVIEGEYALRIDVVDIEAVPLRVSAVAKLADGTVEPIPAGQLVTWFVQIEFPNGEVYTRTEFNAPATNYELVDFAWPIGKIIINVQLGNRLGAYVTTKDTDKDLEFLIDVTMLDGLHIPDDYYDTIVAI